MKRIKRKNNVVGFRCNDKIKSILKCLCDHYDMSQTDVITFMAINEYERLKSKIFSSKYNGYIEPTEQK